MDDKEINRKNSDFIFDDYNLNKKKIKCQFDIEMEAYIDQANNELERLLDVNKCIILL